MKRSTMRRARRWIIQELTRRFDPDEAAPAEDWLHQEQRRLLILPEVTSRYRSSFSHERRGGRPTCKLHMRFRVHRRGSGRQDASKLSR